MHEPERFGLSTRCVHEGRHVDPLTRVVVTPIYENSAYAADLIADLAAALAPLDPGQRPAPPS